MIIGISGKKQHGKNTIAKIIQALVIDKNDPNFFNIPKKNYQKHNLISCLNEGIVHLLPNSLELTSGWQEKSFASKLKQIVCLLIGCTIEQLEDNEFKEKELGEEWRRWYWSYYKMKMDSNPKGKISGYFNSKEEAELYSTSVKIMDKTLSETFPSMILESELLTPRLLLQLLGTECGRNIIHPNIWVNSLMSDYKPYQKCEVWEDQHPNEPAPYYHPRCTDCSKPYNGYKLQPYCKECAKIDKYPNWLITDVRFPNEAEAIKEKGGLLIRVNRDLDQFSDINMREGYYSLPLPDNHPSETALDNYEYFDEVIFNDGNIEDLVEKVKTILVKHKII